MQFDKQELTNLGLLINKSPITGQEATTVALLLQKIGKLLNPEAQITNTTSTNDIPNEEK